MLRCYLAFGAGLISGTFSTNVGVFLHLILITIWVNTHVVAKGYKTCPIIVRGETFVCSVSRTTHYTNCRATCVSRCVVYLATCGICNKQYVGNTTQALCKRVTGHRNGKDHENAGFNEIFKLNVITQTTTEHI